MKLKINWNSKIASKDFLFKKNKKDLLKILKYISKEIDTKSKIVVSLNIFDSEEMKNINNKYRKIDKTTDVLSFPQNEEFMKEYDLGDIIINGDILKEQAESIDSDENTELKFLFMHGLLHLIGYDHQNENDEKKMFDRQKEIFRGTGIRND